MNKRKMHEPNKDCFAYLESFSDKGDCSALNQLYCSFENKSCPFYKKKKAENDFEVGNNDENW